MAADDTAEAIRPTFHSPTKSRNHDVGVVVDGADDVWVKLARCCTPVPGDQIFGFVTRVQGFRFIAEIA